MGRQVAGPELSESAFPIPPAWQFDAACGLEIQGSDPCAYPPVEIAWDSTKPFNNFCPGPGWIFESLRHPKRVASLLKHLQEPHEAHFRLLTHIKLLQAPRFISVLYETVKHLLVNVFWTTETCQMLFDLIAAGR